MVEKLTDLGTFWTKSSSSFKLSDVVSFTVGGQTSRFWLLRKRIISLPKKDHGLIPFYSWNCITIYLWNREVDLVIKNENDLKMLIKYLIYKLQTVDGQRGSALPFLNALTIEESGKIRMVESYAYKCH
jgi:hypothetical protein